jgi:hypothetical protein
VVAAVDVGFAARWDTTVREDIEGVRRRVGIKRRVENSVGCLSEKRLLIKRGNNVVEEADNSRTPACR